MSEDKRSLDERLQEARDVKALNKIWDDARKKSNPMTVMLNIANMPKGDDGEVHIPRIEDWKDDWCKYYIESRDLEQHPHLQRLMTRQKDDFLYNSTMDVWIFQPRLPNTIGSVPQTVFVNDENPHP